MTTESEPTTAGDESKAGESPCGTSLKAKAKPDVQTVQAVKDELRGLIASIYAGGGLEGDKTAVDVLAEALEGVIKGVLPSERAPRARGRISRLLARVALGETYGEALEAEGTSWPEMGALTLHAGVNALNEACKASGWEIQKQRRLSAAHKRGVTGWQEPVYGKDADGNPIQVGSVTRYSDRALELLMKLDHPQLASGGGSAQGGQAGQSGPVAIQINVHLPSSPASQSATIEANPLQ